MIQKKFLLGLLIVPTLALSSCSFNLGTFEKNDGYKSYYDSFAPLRALYDAGSNTGAEDSYDIKNSLFNNMTVNNMTWEKDEYKVNEREYVYLVVTFKEVLKVESLSLYFKANEDSAFSISAFYFVSDDLAPKKIRYLSSPPEDLEADPPISYDEPLTHEASLSYTVQLTKNKWKSITFNKFKQDGYKDGFLHTGSNSVLYLRIENNSGHNKYEMTPVAFTFLNLLVRAVE